VVFSLSCLENTVVLVLKTELTGSRKHSGCLGEMVATLGWTPHEAVNTSAS
jgi:hypothetical protein